MNINKIKELSTVYKVLICIVITIIGLICVKLLISNWENKKESFDYSKVYSVNGVITKIGWDYEIYGYDQHTVQTSAYMNVKLENGETIEIGLGGSTDGYTEGESIIIYTDGIHYSITQEGVASDAQLTIFNMLGACIVMILVVAVWTCFFGWKGLLIGLFVFVVISEW